MSREPIPVHPRFTRNCPKCNSPNLEVRYFMPVDIIASFKVCLDCEYAFYDGTFGEGDMEEVDE